MKGFAREYPLIALCGLGCGLCPIHHMANGCPGCGGGAGNQSCAIARCSLQRGGLEYCCDCPAYPCEKYEETPVYDSFITARNRTATLEKIRRLGPDACRVEMDEKVSYLRALLERCNAGRQKSFFCLALGLLDIEDIRDTMERVAAGTPPEMPVEERAAAAVRLFRETADRRGVALRLNRPKKKK